MQRSTTAILVCLMLVAACAGSDDPDESAATSQPIADSCATGDSDCADDGATRPLPDAVALSDPNDPDALLAITFGGFFYSDGEQSQLCSSLAESFPPQCGSLVIDIEAPLDVVLDHVAQSFGSPEDAKINIDQGIYWTDEWINLSGTLQANRLVLE